MDTASSSTGEDAEAGDPALLPAEPRPGVVEEAVQLPAAGPGLAAQQHEPQATELSTNIREVSQCFDEILGHLTAKNHQRIFAYQPVMIFVDNHV